MQLVGVNDLALDVALPLRLDNLHQRAQPAAGPHHGPQLRPAGALHALRLAQEVLQLLHGRGHVLREGKLREAAVLEAALEGLHCLRDVAQHLRAGGALAAAALALRLDRQIAVVRKLLDLLVGAHEALVHQDLARVVEAPQGQETLRQAHDCLLLQELGALLLGRHGPQVLHGHLSVLDNALKLAHAQTDLRAVGQQHAVGLGKLRGVHLAAQGLGVPLLRPGIVLRLEGLVALLLEHPGGGRVREVPDDRQRLRGGEGLPTQGRHREVVRLHTVEGAALGHVADHPAEALLLGVGPHGLALTAEDEAVLVPVDGHVAALVARGEVLADGLGVAGFLDPVVVHDLVRGPPLLVGVHGHLDLQLLQLVHLLLLRHLVRVGCLKRGLDLVGRLEGPRSDLLILDVSDALPLGVVHRAMRGSLCGCGRHLSSDGS
mmetsp:Transcript_50399/g.155856  ORF Transcript_50399/g.155856 Transcript_50399/m.155856 type:complete len:433 (+) Transcript_50399:1488-2786(+)